MIVLGLALTLWAAAAQPAAAPEDVKFVEVFIKTSISDLTAAKIEHFMAIDARTLPKKLRLSYQARRVELHTLKQLAEGRKKGTVRTPEKDCAVPAEAKSDEPVALVQAGFMELQEDEEQYLLDKTQCTERDLLCESSLQIIVERDRKTQKVRRRRYFLYPSDPLSAFIAGYRAGGNVGGNTNFFGRSNVLCSH